MSNPINTGNRPRYQMIRELGRDREGVCITYLAKDNATQQPVVLTRFVSSYQDYQQQIQLLRELHHPGIPRYIDSFQTPDGFCLVQEYKESQPLTVASNPTVEQIKQIAVSVLEILVYLQNRTPPVLHRNIKPETIFVDAQMNVYLMDFGGAQIGGADMPLYRIVAKKSGFVSPELLRNRPATQASDLYSLGATLMCLLTQTESTKINTLISQTGEINVKGLVATSLSLGLIDWLETMLAPNPKFRYPNAVAALDALKTIDVTRFADVQFNPASIELKAIKYGEVLTHTVTVINPITDTLLTGKWSEAGFITFSPSVLSGNKTVCQLAVDTGKLMAGKAYERQILLHANSSQKTHSLPIKVQTPAIKPQKMLYGSLASLGAISLVGGWFGALVVGITPDLINWVVLAIGLAVGGVGGGAAAFSKIDLFVKSVGMILTLVTIVGFVALAADLDMVVGFFVGLAIAAVAGMVIKHHVEKNFSQVFAVWTSILTAALGMSLGIDLKLNFQNPLAMFAVLVTGVPLAIALVNPYLQYLKVLHNYRKSQPSLIKP
jgi:serine/threonine protein kinase